MGDLLQPWHAVVILAIIIGAVVFLKRSRATTESHNSVLPLESTGSTLPESKYCSECGKQIKRRAEICPLCGCRQAS